MKKLSLFIGAMLLILAFSSLSLAETKIAVVDVNRVIATVPQIKNMQADLTKRFGPRKQEIDQLQNSLRSDIEAYHKNSLDTSTDILKARQQELLDKEKKLQEMRISLQRDFVTTQTQALNPILKQIDAIVNKIGQDQKFDLIVTRISLAYNVSPLEITDQVITEMNKAAEDSAKASKVVTNHKTKAKTKKGQQKK